MKCFKYQGAGNDFILFDSRETDFSPTKNQIIELCDRHYGLGADGLIVLKGVITKGLDFKMEYYNSDGSGGMMCGNGGRCIVAFARDLGFKSFNFIAPDGIHSANFEDDINIRLRMKDLEPMVLGKTGENDYFLNTGTRHHIRFVTNLKSYPVPEEGREIRNLKKYTPEGVNANFVEILDTNKLAVRTYEKGVEGETFSCGTGVVASSISYFLKTYILSSDLEKKITVEVLTLKDKLKVEFMAKIEENILNITEIYLTGPAKRVAEIILP